MKKLIGLAVLFLINMNNVLAQELNKVTILLSAIERCSLHVVKGLLTKHPELLTIIGVNKKTVRKNVLSTIKNKIITIEESLLNLGDENSELEVTKNFEAELGKYREVETYIKQFKDKTD